MLTTLQVRAIMRKHNVPFGIIYTNKWKNCGNVRSVKCYQNRDDKANTKLLKALYKAAGLDNVNETAGSDWMGRGGITVRCTIA